MDMRNKKKGQKPGCGTLSVDYKLSLTTCFYAIMTTFQLFSNRPQKIRAETFKLIEKRSLIRSGVREQLYNCIKSFSF